MIEIESNQSGLRSLVCAWQISQVLGSAHTVFPDFEEGGKEFKMSEIPTTVTTSALALFAAGGGPAAAIAIELIDGNNAVVMVDAAHGDAGAGAGAAAGPGPGPGAIEPAVAGGEEEDDGGECNWCGEPAIQDDAHLDPDEPRPPNKYLCNVCVMEKDERRAYTKQFLQPALRMPSAQIRPIAIGVGNRYFPGAAPLADDQSDHIIEIQVLAKLVAQAEHGGESWSGNVLFAMRRWANSSENLSRLSTPLNNLKGIAFKPYVPGAGPLPQVAGLPTLRDEVIAALRRLRVRVGVWRAHFMTDVALFDRFLVKIDAMEDAA